MFDIRVLLQVVHSMVEVQVVAFDVDGTLIDDMDQPRWEVIDLLRAFHALGWRVIVWSGGGDTYAKHWVYRLGLGEFVTYSVAKDKKEGVTLAVDDTEGADLGIVATIIV